MTDVIFRGKIMTLFTNTKPLARGLNRGKSMKLLLPLLMSAFSAASLAQSPPAQLPSGAQLPKTTEVMVMLTARQGVTRQQIMNIMPAEIRETVKLYLNGKIRQWYSRGDGRGVIFLIDARTVDEARAVMEPLPLAKEKLMDYEYIPIGPLMPLSGLIGESARQ
jgi:hypothetical protein